MRRSRRPAASNRTLVAGVALFGLATASGVAEGATRYLPGVASVAGRNGARFESTVWLTNLGTADATVSLGWIPSSGSAPPPASRHVRAGETLRIERPLSTLFGLSESFGTLVLTGGSAVEVRGVTADVSRPAGSYGLDLHSVGEESTLLAGETGHIPWVANDRDRARGYRTNIAVALLSPDARAVVTLYDEAGFVRGVETVASSAPVTWQAAVDALSGDPDLALGRVEIALLSGEAAAYAAVVDNVTGDGVLVPSERLRAGPSDLLLDGAARAPGRNGTVWSTDVRLFNPGGAPLPVTLAWLGREAVGASVTRTVPPRGLLELTDVLGPGGLGLGNGVAGGLRLSAPGAFLAAGRTANRPGEGGGTGTYGAYVAPARWPGALLSAGIAAAFSALADDAGTAGFRTNLALLAADAPASGTLTLFDASGRVQATAPFALVAREWRQARLSDWFGGRAIPLDARLDLRVDAGSADAYASVIDNGTGDPVLLRPVRLAPAPCVTASIASFTAARSTLAPGESATLRLEAGGGAGLSARVVPGDLPIPLSGETSVSPPLPSGYRAVVEGGCSTVVSGTALVDVRATDETALTTSGPVRGVRGGGAVAFRGIPYAAPPVGPLRFRPPVAADGWAGVRDASSFGPICPQLDAQQRFVGAEACLALNVFAPPSPASPRPVLVFVHGGANYEGASSLDVYDGRPLASAFGAVVVTLNYRLGALGFLAHPALGAESARHVSGNYGLLDQIAALSWVKRNAASFGGDPSRVLLFGESAGGYDTCALLVSPLARGLFSRALIESGACASVPLADVEGFGQTIVQAAGCGGAGDIAACLRSRSAADVVSAVPGRAPVYASTGQLYGYSVDGWVVPEDPLEALRSGRHHRAPFAIGTNAHETARFTPAVLTPFDYQAQLFAQYGVALGTAVLARYPVFSYASPFRALVAVTSDARFICPARRVARAVAAGQAEPVFRYSFEHALDSTSLAAYGAYHGLELPFVFQTLDAFPGFSPSARERDLARAMGAAWVRFAESGDPAGGGLAWPRYDAATDPYVRFDTPIGAGQGLRAPQCDFWDGVVSARPEPLAAVRGGP